MKTVLPATPEGLVGHGLSTTGLGSGIRFRGSEFRAGVEPTVHSMQTRSC